MKKFFVIFAMLICSIGMFAGCKDTPSISCDQKTISVFQNQLYNLNKLDIDIENYDKGHVYSVGDENIVKVVNDRLIPQTIGKTELVISLDGYSEINTKISVEVKEGYITEWVDIDKTLVKINKGLNEVGENKLTFNANSTEIPVVTYDTDLITYNYLTGIITPKKTGTTTVNIEFIECSVSFEVVVTEVVYTEMMLVNNCTIYKSTMGKIPFSVFPTTANTYRFWTNNSTLMRIESDGTYQTYGCGDVVVYYQYYTAFNTLSSINSFVVTIADTNIDYEIDIRDDRLESVNNYLLNENYKLVISCDNTIDKKLFTVSNNIDIKSTFTYVENVGYVADFQFINGGSVKIDVKYTPSEDTTLQSIRSKTVSVYSENDVRVVATWSAYIQEKFEGKYRIFITNDPGMPTYLEIKLYLGEIIYNVPFEVYLLEGDNTLSMINKSFTSSQAGDYTLVVKMGEKEIDRIIISVVNL